MFNNTKKLFVKENIAGIQIDGGQPFINIPTKNLYSGVSYMGMSDKKLMMQYAKSHLIVIGIIKAITDDIVTRINFTPTRTKQKGRPKSIEGRVDDAVHFAKTNMFKKMLTAAVFDWLITGEAFLWHGSVSRAKIKEIYSKLAVMADDLDVKGVHMIRHVASTTMIPKYDDHELLIYTQMVGNKQQTWKAENIIHAKLMDLDGKPNGFTPMFAAKPMIETLGLIIDYAGEYFDGGGSPEIAFIFPNESATSSNFIKAKQEIRQRYAKTKTRGNMFFAGDMRTEKINDWNKDMEFRKLFVMYVGSIAFSFNMPLHRIQSILGGDMSSGAGASDLSDSGYWRSIYEAQDYWETLVNMGFWNEAFDVDMQFERTYLQDTFREVQATNLTLTNIEMMEKLNIIKPNYKKEVYKDMLALLDIPLDAISDDIKMEQPLPRAGLMPNSDMLRGQATKRFSEQKKSEAGKTSAEQKGN